jgi:hypothetical protein
MTFDTNNVYDDDIPLPAEAPLKATYARLETDREPFLNRARACSAITIPSLVPPKGHTPWSTLPTPFQSVGARGVNNMAAKLLLTQLPPNQPFFKLAMEDRVREELGARVGDAEKGLNKYERIVVADMESSAVRPAGFEFFKHMIVGGNALTYDSPTGKLRVYGLRQYVCQRDPAGNALLIILREDISPLVVPPAIRQAVMEGEQHKASGSAKTLELYTGIMRVGDFMVVHQEINGVHVPGSDAKFPIDKCPWNAARMIIVEGEDYGRSYVEEFIGDLKSLELLTRSMVQASVAAAKVVYLVNPNGITDEEDIEEAEGGDVKTGRAEDVTALTLEKQADFSIVEQRIQRLTESLSYAFLLNSAIQRNAERVTAEEIRYMAQELESTLGGLYSSLSQEFQLPLVRSRIANLERKGKLPALPKGAVKPMITTGVDAIGRGNDFEKLRTYTGFLAEALGPEMVAQRINPTELANRAAAGIGIEPDGLVRTEEEIADEQEAQQQAAMQQAAVAPTINQAGQMMQAGMTQPAQ